MRLAARTFAADRDRWLLATASFATALALAMFLAQRGYMVDIDVYLMGGRHVLDPGLYSLVLFGHSGLLFTYAPFAALAFAPLAWGLTLIQAQEVWAVVNLASLFGLLAVAIRTVRPDLERATAWRWALTLSFPAVFLDPVFLTIGFGQVNLVLDLFVLWDLIGPRRVGSRTLPLGVATGIAAAIKLTPLIFVPYLLLTRRTRGAFVCLATFVVCEVAAFAVSPASSWVYWTKDVFDSGRAGYLLYISDQNLSSVLQRFHHGQVPTAVLWPALAVILVAGLALAAWAYRSSSPMLGLLVCATTGLVISPVTWTHHLVWVVPAIIWMAAGADRPRHGLGIAVATSLLFWASPIWWVPNNHHRELHENAWQLVAGNSFFLAMCGFLIGVTLMLVSRHVTSRRADAADAAGVADSLPEPAAALGGAAG
jgi:alpha-1,2-mannosyltransferase